MGLNLPVLEGNDENENLPESTIQVTQKDQIAVGFCFFQFYGISNQAPPGTYRVTAIADGYLESSTLSFDLARAESIDLGDIEVMPDQIQFGEVKACETLKAGGKCEFGLKFRNRGPRTR